MVILEVEAASLTMLRLPRRVKVIDVALILNSSCTWHGHPGLQAGNMALEATQCHSPKPKNDSSTQAPGFFCEPCEAAKA